MIFLKSSGKLSGFVRCQALGEEWVKAGKVREIPGGGSVEEYKEVNRKESLDLADAFLSTKFVNHLSPEAHHKVTFSRKKKPQAKRHRSSLL